MRLNVCFIGAGNLATQLSKSLCDKGCKIIQVYSRTESSAKVLADLVEASYTASTESITENADVYFVALKDAAFEEVLPKINFGKHLVVHCAGSLPLQILENYSENFGVFYPLQTFSKTRDVDFSKIPIFIEANSKKSENILVELGLRISSVVSIVNSEERKSLHIAAVFACNFVNHFYNIASEILGMKNLSFDLLKPLILETALKVQQLSPEEAQTGPAVRFDKNIIGNHLAELEKIGRYAELYKSVSESIFVLHNESRNEFF